MRTVSKSHFTDIIRKTAGFVEQDRCGTECHPAAGEFRVSGSFLGLVVAAG
jgi:hypothetical protein